MKNILVVNVNKSDEKRKHCFLSFHVRREKVQENDERKEEKFVVCKFFILLFLLDY